VATRVHCELCVFCYCVIIQAFRRHGLSPNPASGELRIHRCFGSFFCKLPRWNLRPLRVKETSDRRATLLYTERRTESLLVFLKATLTAHPRGQYPAALPWVLPGMRTGAFATYKKKIMISPVNL